jgi:hypothetical protein
VEWIKQDSSKGQCPMCRQSTLHELKGRTGTDWEQNSNGRTTLPWEHLCELDDDGGIEYCIGLELIVWENKCWVHDTTVRASDTIGRQGMLEK